jgi:transposase
VAASGGYERLVRRLPVERGIQAAVVEPVHVRHVIKTSGLLARTDRLDALVLGR